MHRKINIFAALLIIVILAIISAWAISVRAFSGINFGGRVTTYIPAATCANPYTCSVCIPCGCGSWDNVVFTPFGGNSFYVCPPAGFRYQGPPSLPGFQILGGGFNVYAPFQISTSF